MQDMFTLNCYTMESKNTLYKKSGKKGERENENDV